MLKWRDRRLVWWGVATDDLWRNPTNFLSRCYPNPNEGTKDQYEEHIITSQSNPRLLWGLKDESYGGLPTCSVSPQNVGTWKPYIPVGERAPSLLSQSCILATRRPNCASASEDMYPTSNRSVYKKSNLINISIDSKIWWRAYLQNFTWKRQEIIHQAIQWLTRDHHCLSQIRTFTN